MIANKHITTDDLKDLPKYERLKILFDRIEVECLYYPLLQNGDGIFTFFNEAEMDLNRLILQSIDEIEEFVTWDCEKELAIELLKNEL